MSQRIVSPPSGPIKRGLHRWLTSNVKSYDLRLSRWEPIHLFSLAAEHRRRPGCFETFRNLGHGIRVVFSLAVAALLFTPISAAAVGQTTRVNVASDGTQGNGFGYIYSAAISANGRYVVFNSDSNNLVPGDTNGYSDGFVHDRVSRKTVRVSIASDGAQGNNFVENLSISADGNHIAFDSFADNMVPGDINGTRDVFIHDIKTRRTTQVSIASDGTKGVFASAYPVISADGRYVAFLSDAYNLVPGDTNGLTDVFVHDRKKGLTTRISVASDSTEANGYSPGLALSADGRYVSFSSEATNLVQGDTNEKLDVFLHDRVSGKTTRISVDSNGVQGNDTSYGGLGAGTISADGRYMGFVSYANNLAPGDTNGLEDVFIHDRVSGKTKRVNLSSDGTQINYISNSSVPAISADGRYVAFSSFPDNLVPGLAQGGNQIFLHDNLTGQTTLLSLGSDNIQGNDASYAPWISSDGRYVSFSSYSSNLVSGDTNGNWDVFVRDRLLLPNKKADLSVTQSESGDPVVKGRKLTYTVKVKNNGRDPASDVNLTDLVPLEAQLLSVTPSQGSCYKAPITVCRLGKLSPGAGAQVHVKLKAIRSGVTKNTVSVNAAPKDLAPYNNSSTISTLIK